MQKSHDGWFVAILVVGLCFIATMAIPRFVSGDISTPQGLPVFVSSSGDVRERLVVDQVEYLRLTEFYNGTGPATDVAPFTHRWLVPRLASLLPFESIVAINVVNLAALSVGLLSLLLLLRRWALSPLALLAASTAYSLCFPVLWYSSSSFVDAAAVGLVSLVVLAAYQRWWMGALVLVPAVMMKESALVCVPFGIALEFVRTPRRPLPGTIVRMATWPAAGLVGLALASLFAPRSTLQFWPWIPDDLTALRKNISGNLSTPVFMAEILLTVSVPAAGVMLAWYACLRRGLRPPVDRIVPLSAGVIAAAGLSFMSFVSAVWEGRTAWMLIPFALPLVGIWIDAGRANTHSTTAQLTADQPPDELRLRSDVARRAAMVCAATLLIIAAPLLSSVQRMGNSPSAEDPSHGCRFAGSLAEQLRSPAIRSTGEGPGDVELPRSATPTPLVARIEVQGSGPFTASLASSPTDDGEQVLRTNGPYRGSILLDVTQDDRWLRMTAESRWTLTLLPVAQMLQGTGEVPIDGAGDVVMVVPGGTRAEAWASFVAGDAQVAPVGRSRFSNDDLRAEALLPRGTEAIVVRSEGPWKLRVRRSGEMLPGFGC